MVFDLNDIETKKLLAIFAQHEKNIDYLIYLRDLIWQKPVTSGDSIKVKTNIKKEIIYLAN